MALTLRMLAVALMATLATAASAAETVQVERQHEAWEQRKFTGTVALQPVLHLPAGDGPFALVVIVNSSGGAEDVFLQRFPVALTDAGIAAAALDTFSPRGIVNTVMDQSQISAFSMSLDALAVARHFAGDPRIDARRIAVAGHSKGGAVVTHLANVQFYRRFRAAPQFATGVAFSPACFSQLAASVSAFPIYGLTGSRDDVTPPEYCASLFARLDGKPFAARFEVVPDTYHSWSLKGPGLRFAPNLPNVARGPCARDAPFLNLGQGKLKSARTGAVLSLDRFRARCAGGFGKTFGGGREMLPVAFDKAIGFLRTTLSLEPR